MRNVYHRYIVAGVLTGLCAGPTPVQAQTQLLTNPGFEDSPFLDGWSSSQVLSVPGLDGSVTAARLPWNTRADLQRGFSPTTEFTADVLVDIAGTNEPRSFQWSLLAGGGPVLSLRTGLGGQLEVQRGADWVALEEQASGTPFNFTKNATHRLRIIGRKIGMTSATYDLVWSNFGSTSLVHATHGLSAFHHAAATNGNGLTGIQFDHSLASANSFIVDAVSVVDVAEAPPPQTHVLPAPPPPPVVRNIRGIYPHLAMTSVQNECGIGAVVPWADRLWAVTYAPHKPNGSDDKLYEIDTNLVRTVRPESIGGTPANRMIHDESQQPIIGPYFIDTNRNVRTIPYTTMPGRHTANARHLDDPANQVYFFTMEDGVYEVDVNTLSVNTIYPDVQGTGDSHLHGYHGKGAYSGQGYLYAANNGRNWNTGDPTGDAGALARWDGSLPHAWEELYRVQHCEITGPGGLHGNTHPATDPIWTTGFDAKSVILRSIENGTAHTWRLPKASYSHDGSHGWHTEWPRIREIEPGVRLMHMHGIFFDFPPTFSSTNPGGLQPICNYYKMPVDYCMFNGRLVISKNDTSKFNNALVKRNQSNLWFGQLDDLHSWGAPGGFGAVWMNENAPASAISDPFLVNGFARVVLHLRHATGSDVDLEIQTRSGIGAWTPLRTVTVPASGYTHELMNGHGVEWVRLVVSDAVTDLTAAFHVGNPYPHATPASLAGDQFAALADIRDESGFTDGIIRVMTGADLQLEMATTGGYARIDDQLTLEPVTDPVAESSLRSEGSLSQEFGSDAASAWISEGGITFRLPRLSPAYDAPFPSGWARGFREVVTERQLLNCHGTFYEVPRDNSGGVRKMRPLTTHGKRITDFASWRGLLVLTGVLDSAPVNDSVVKTEDGSGALWLGEVDDLWRMGEPRGKGGPWKDTLVAANAPSDPYLMVGYDRKVMTLSHHSAEPVQVTVEVDVLADDTWSTYGSFAVNAGEMLTHEFPEGYAAHWVRLRSDTATTVTAQYEYGPVDAHDAFMDWARDEGLPTGRGRAGLLAYASDADRHPLAEEFSFGLDPSLSDAPDVAMQSTGSAFQIEFVMLDEPQLDVVLESSQDFVGWDPVTTNEVPGVDQAGVDPGLMRRVFEWEDSVVARYIRWRMQF